MEKRALIAVVLSLLILILYQEWMTRQYGTPPPPAPESQPADKPPEKVAPPAPKPQPKLEVDKAPAPGRPQAGKEVKVETDHYVAIFTSQGARLKSFKFKQYRAAADQKSPPFELIPSTPDIPYPLGLQLSGAGPATDDGLVYVIEGGDLKLSGDGQGTLRFRAQTPRRTTLKKEFTFTGSSYAIGLKVSAEGGGVTSAPEVILTSDAGTNGPKRDAHFEGFLAQVDGKTVREHGEALAKGKELSGAVSWAGLGHTYFLFAVLPEGGKEQKISVTQTGPAVTLKIGAQAQGSGETSAVHTLFIGPKQIDTLKSMDRGLEHAIDFGYFGLVSMPLLYVLHFSHRFTSSYGIDIILLTILIKLLMAPLTHKSFASMKQMQKLQPQMERLKEKFKDEKEKLNKEIMELYRRNKVNPFGGCLPMVLQFPVFIGLYNALQTPIELRHAPFLWINDLSRPDWEALPFAFSGWSLGVPILTLLMGASMFVQQWMTPSAGDPNQRRMMLMMPLIFTFMFINFPSGLTIYWLVNNILTIAQQYLISRRDS
jgi:YidC/Oxa1 family membrane protein insertase